MKSQRFRSHSRIAQRLVFFPRTTAAVAILAVAGMRIRTAKSVYAAGSAGSAAPGPRDSATEEGEGTGGAGERAGCAESLALRAPAATSTKALAAISCEQTTRATRRTSLVLGAGRDQIGVVDGADDGDFVTLVALVFAQVVCDGCGDLVAGVWLRTDHAASSGRRRPSRSERDTAPPVALTISLAVPSFGVCRPAARSWIVAHRRPVARASRAFAPAPSRSRYSLSFTRSIYGVPQTIASTV